MNREAGDGRYVVPGRLGHTEWCAHMTGNHCNCGANMHSDRIGQYTMLRRTDKVKDEVARQAQGMSPQQYAEFLTMLARQLNTMASYASGKEGRPTLEVVRP